MALALSIDDKNVIDEVTDFIKLEEESVNGFITEFADKGCFGLWMDAKGFWNFSDKQTVLNSMEIYRKIYRPILTCIQSAANNDVNAYEQITDLYKRIEELERDAFIHVNGESKALSNLAQKFLHEHWNLDHYLKTVECIVLKTELKKTKEISKNLTKTFNKDFANNEILQGENQNLKSLIDTLLEENLDLKNKIDNLFKEGEDLKNLFKK